MADSRKGSRVARAGISCVAGVAVPAVAFAATIPFEGAHDMVVANVVPFALGSVAGIGILTAVSGVADRRIRRQEEDVAARPAGDRYADLGGRGALPKDVPVITRAQDALSEEEAWAEIDATFTDGSPISCDATSSKDIYQIALEELQRGTHASAPAESVDAVGYGVAASAAGASSGYASQPFAADSTATYVALSGAGAAATADLSEADDMTGATTTPLDEDDSEEARRAALASLDSFGESTVDHAADAAKAAAARITTKAEAGVLPIAPSSSAAMRAAGASGPFASARVASMIDDLDLDEVDDEEYSVPMVDYSGHEDMWAQALAILSEEPETNEVEQAYAPKHFRAAGTGVAASAAAVAAREQRLDNHVEEASDDTLDRASTQGARRASREYLRVIQGGTASFPRQQAEVQ